MNEKENLTIEYIYSAFLQLLNKKEYDNISVCEICEKAGVSRMSFYRNFESKDDLLFKGIDRIAKSIAINIEQLDNRNLYTVAQEIFKIAKNYKNALFSIQDSQVSKIIKDMVIEDLQTKTPIDYMNKTSKYIPIFYFSSIIAVLIEWLRNGAIESPEEMATLLAKLINLDSCKNPEID